MTCYIIATLYVHKRLYKLPHNVSKSTNVFNKHYKEKKEISLWPVQVNRWGCIFLPGWFEGRGLRQKTDSCSCLLHWKLTHWSGQYDPILYTSNPKQLFIDIVWEITSAAILIQHCTPPANTDIQCLNNPSWFPEGETVMWAVRPRQMQSNPSGLIFIQYPDCVCNLDLIQRCVEHSQLFPLWRGVLNLFTPSLSNHFLKTTRTSHQYEQKTKKKQQSCSLGNVPISHFLSVLHILHTLIFIVSLHVPGFYTLRYLILLYWTFSLPPRRSKLSGYLLYLNKDRRQNNVQQ